MNSTMQISRTADKKIIKKMMDDEKQKYHPLGVSVQHRDLCYNLTIRQKRIEDQPRRGAKIMDMAMRDNLKTRRVDKIIALENHSAPKPRRGDKIIKTATTRCENQNPPFGGRQDCKFYKQ